MKVRTLTPHPSTPSSAVDRIEVEFDHEGRSSALAIFRLKGRIANIVVPPVSARVEEVQRRDRREFVQAALENRFDDLPGASEVARADGLWRTTCFEAFAGLNDGGYAEFNASLSKEWAAYRFDGYRQGMRNLGGSVDVFTVERDEQGLTIGAWLNWSEWPRVHRVGVSAVIEETDGTISYWALAHPSDKPDFHHPDSFVLELP
ncbi:MAG: DOMON-like domain-containing protein [Caulobacteraceae bacterium]|nr:MAG: DOMON-like domain-containing protein [Caulobacteraceae bacterium]